MKEGNGLFKTLSRAPVRGGVALGILSIFAVGFSTWIIQTNIYARGLEVSADTIDDAIIQELAINDVKYATGYGFVDDTQGIYANNTDLKGQFKLSIENAKRISSFASDKTLSINLSFEPSLKTDFTFGATTSVTGIANNPASQDISSSFAGSFAFALTDSEYSSSDSIDCNFSISMGYTGSSFPDLSTATFKVFIIPEEYQQ